MRKGLLVVACLGAFAVATGAARSWASAETDCVPAQAPQNAGITNLARNVTEAAGKLACVSSAESGLAEARADYEAAFPGDAPKQEENVAGARLQGSVQELELARGILGQKPPASWNRAAASCRDVRCALAGVFGSEEAALRAMTVAKETGYSLSLSQHLAASGDERVWKADQVREFQKLMRKLPPTFRNMKELKNIHLISETASAAQQTRHKLTGKGFAGLMVTAEDAIYVNEDGLTGFRNGISDVFAHELGHAYDFSHTHEGKDFRAHSHFDELSGWSTSMSSPGVKSHAHDHRAHFPSEYSATSPAEDLAETVMYYVNDPETLRLKAPEKFAHVKDAIFGGKEYPAYREIVSPELEAAVAAGGGYEGVLKRCLSQTRTHFGGDTAWFFDAPESGARESGVRESFPTEAFARRSKCYQREAEALSRSLGDACRLGGVAAIADHLREKISHRLEWAVSEADRAARFLQKSADGAGGNACWSRKDFSPECALAQVAAAPYQSVGKATWVESGRPRQQLPEEIALASEAIAGPSAEGLARSTDRPLLVMTCLSAVKSVRRNGDSVYYLYEGMSSSALKGEKCADAVRAGLELGGYRLGQTGRRVSELVIGERPLVEEKMAFEKKVLGPWGRELASCGDANCRATKVRKLLERWIRESGGNVGSIPPGFEKLLLKLVK